MTKRHRQLAAQHQDLLRRKKELGDEARAIGDAAEQAARLQTDAERKRVGEILTELDGLKENIDSVEAELDAEVRLGEHDKAQIMRLTQSGGGALPTQEFSGMGEFLQAVAVSSDSVWRARLGGSKADELMNKLTAYQAAASGASVGVPSDGGFLVRKDWSAAMLDRAKEQATLLPRTRGVPIGGDFDALEYPYIDESSRATGSRWGGVQVFWVAEADTVTAKKPKIGKGELKLEEIMGLAYATERLIRDASALEGILSNSFESEVGFQIDDAIFRGNGVGKPQGFFQHPCWVEVAKEGSQAADTVVVANLLKMYARMPARLKAGAVWLIHPDVMTQLPQMSIGNQPVWLPPSGNLTSAPAGLLLGRPVVELEQANELGKVGDIVLANLNEYVTITKANEGLRYDTSMHVKFDTNQTAFRWVFRINGQPTWRTKLAPYKGASDLSPFIGLADRD
jgi:HK97 family phage major capsid protein